jgi:hypothetical protein
MDTAMQIVMKSLVASVLILMGSLSWADCACFCADGAQTTMCNTIEEAQANTNECFASQDIVCPTSTYEGSETSYEIPAADATNCRDVSIWKNNGFELVKACDVVAAF